MQKSTPRTRTWQPCRAALLFRQSGALVAPSMSLEGGSSMKRTTTWISIIGLLVAVLGLLLTLQASAQSTTNGAICGNVRDTHGLTVSTATVKIINKGTNHETTAVRDD